MLARLGRPQAAGAFSSPVLHRKTVFSKHLIMRTFQLGEKASGGVHGQRLARGLTLRQGGTQHRERVTEYRVGTRGV